MKPNIVIYDNLAKGTYLISIIFKYLNRKQTNNRFVYDVSDYKIKF